MPNILAIDQGTTNTKAILVNEAGHIVARASRPLAVRYPRPGWVEQDPLDLWDSTRAAITDCLNRYTEGGHNLHLAAVAVTNQRESVVAWERATGDPIGPVVVWQCRRTTPFVAELRAQGHSEEIHARTGLQLDPLFSASKARWLLDQAEDGFARAQRGEICIGTVDSWVLWNLSGGMHACDMTNASRTQLFNLHTLAWDDDLLALFEVPGAALPQVHPSSAHYSATAALDPLPEGVPIAAMIGDSHGALYGHAGFRPGAIKATYGTGTSLMTPIPNPVLSENGLSTTVAWSRQEGKATYAFEGNITVTGAAVQWLAQILGLENGAAVEALAREVASSDDVYVVPAFVGLGAPHWDADARGTMTGLTRGTTPAHLARATLEAIAYQIRDVFDLMQAEAGSPLTTLMADGGASQNDLLMQFQADLLACPVERSTTSDVSALGAAYLAGLTTGHWASEDEITALPRPHDTFAPAMPEAERAARYRGWQRAIARTMYKP